MVGYREGSTILELTARFDCDQKTVMRFLKLHCVEMRYRRMNAEQVDEAVELYGHGVSLTKLGKRFGVDPKTVKARLVERNVSDIRTSADH